jgi:hypothetical protein
MPRGIYKDISCKKLNRDKNFVPKPHQEFVLNYFLTSPYKGLLLFHKLGSGKTCTSILIATEMIKRKTIDHVYILSSGSLRVNWLKEYCQVCGETFLDDGETLSKDLKEKYTFVTYNYNINKIIETLNFDKSLVIIDEVHNLINGVKNQSLNKTSLYDKIMESDCKVLALSGTPIVRKTYEWSFLGNLLKPGAFPNILEDGKVVPELWDPEYDASDESLEGIVSYFPGNPEFYPETHYKDPIKIEMSENQWVKFNDKDEFEHSVRRNGAPSKELKIKDREKYDKQYANFILASKYIFTRKISNFDYLTDENYKSPDFLKKDGGWIDDDTLKGGALLNMSSKFVSVILNVTSSLEGKHVIYSFFKTKSGVRMFHSLFKKYNKGKEKKDKIRCEIFSGDLTDYKRKKLLERFNSKKNRNGEKIKILLITEAGAEGITLTETNNLHILESSDIESKVKQVIGRVIRYKSHYDLEASKQYVNIWRYWSTGPQKKMGIDEILYNRGVVLEKIIEDFSLELQKNSIENPRPQRPPPPPPPPPPPHGLGL